MDDMKNVIIPKSDQLNADDLLAGPKTIKVSGVTIKGGQEQPISISYEGDNGKPYKACKSMCRVMVAVWGPDSSKYVGKSMTLYCDPKVRWAGMEVGGIRISHMSDIAETMTMALTVTRGNKKPYVIKPLERQSMSAWANKVASSESSTIPEVAPAIERMAFLQDLLDKHGETLNPVGVDLAKKAIAAKDDAEVKRCLVALRGVLEPKGEVFPECAK
jgi:hypothetical protein